MVVDLSKWLFLKDDDLKVELKIVSEYDAEIGSKLTAETEGVIVLIQIYIAVWILVEIESSV
jgi:hypothetical protein